MEKNKNTILIVEDDIGLTELVKEKIKELGYETVCVHSAEDAYSWLDEYIPFLIILDYRLPSMNGKELIIKLKEKEYKLPPFIITTGMRDERIAVEMMKLGAQDYVIKDINFIDIIPIVIKKVSIDIEKENKFTKALKSLSISEERLRNMFDNMKSAVAIYKTDDSGETFFFNGWNKRAKELENIDEKEVIGKKLNDIFPFAFESGFINYIRKVWETGESIQVPDFYYASEDGKIKGWRSNFVYKNFVTDEIVSIYEDITERKESAEKLEETVSLLRATLESTAEGVLVVDFNGKVIQHNKRFIEMWNIPDGFIDDRDDAKLLNYVVEQLKYPEQFTNKVKELYSDYNTVSFDVLEFKDGRYYDRYSIPQKISIDRTVGRVWSFRDVTEKKKAEIELIKAKEKAEESDKLKSEFLSSMTHEIRTPMNSILGFSSQINKDTPPNKLMDYINVINSSGELLITILDDIIDLSKLQSGVFKIEKEYFNINNMLIKSEEEYNQHIKVKGKNIKLVLDLGKFSFKTYSDNNRIKQVLNNLIINAIKFTETGSITYGYDKDDKYITFFVKDTGIGISDENISKVFERFYRVTSITQKKQEGTGLGLTISKAIVELLGGKIWVDSKLGVGSTFYFTIPIEVNSEKTIEKKKVIKKKYEWDNKKVLIVEDNMTNFYLLELLLVQTKIKIFHAKNGEDFYNLIKKEKYDIILLDIQLTDISGFEILEYIKKNTKIPVIIQTAFGSKEDMDKAQELKTDAYILKPIIWDTLSKEMERLLNL